MPFRFISPNSDGGFTDLTIEALTLRDAFQRFKAGKPGHGWFAIWCGLRLAGYVRIDEDEAELVDLKTEPPSHANPFACGD